MIHTCMNRTLLGDNHIHAFWLELVAGVPHWLRGQLAIKGERGCTKRCIYVLAFQFVHGYIMTNKFLEGQKSPSWGWRCPHTPLSSKERAVSSHSHTTEVRSTWKSSLQIEMGWKKEDKQGMRCKNSGRLPYTYICCVFCRHTCRVVFLRSFTSCLVSVHW